MAWAMVAGAAITVIGGAIAGKGAKKEEKKKRKHELFMQQEEHRLGLEKSLFERQADEHYVQKERKTRQRGLDEFRKFSTVGEFAPNYTDTSQRVEVPVLPAVSTQQGTNVPVVAAPVAPTPPIIPGG